MHLFYAPDISGESHIFSEEESKHCCRVLRLTANDEVMLTDGKGNMYTAHIELPHPKQTLLKIVSKIENYGKRNYYLHIAIAPTKNNERMEFFLEKATEIGIDEITPILCQHSERKVINHERFHKIITSAVKQSVKAYHPKLNQMTAFKKLIQEASEEQKLIAHCEGLQKTELVNSVEKDGKILILIGPEGDFSMEEITYAENKGYKGTSLGSARLRTETAGIVACNTISLINEFKNKF